MPARTVAVFLHGSCDTGPDFRAGLHALSNGALPPACVDAHFPTAESVAYTPAGGTHMTVWFDRPGGLRYEACEDDETLHNSVIRVNALLTQAVHQIAREGGGEEEEEAEQKEKNVRVVLIGFSMGGALALNVMMHRMRNGLRTDAVMTLSAFMSLDADVLQVSQMSAMGPNVVPKKVVMWHGERDHMVSWQFGADTARRLTQAGFTVHFTKQADVAHQISFNATTLILDFLSRHT